MEVRPELGILALGAGLLLVGVQHWRGRWAWLRRPLPPHRAGAGGWLVAGAMGLAFILAALIGLLPLPADLQLGLGVVSALLVGVAAIGRLLVYGWIFRPPWERALLTDREVRERRRAQLAGASFGIDVVLGHRARPLEETFLTRELAERRAREELAAGPGDYVEVVDLRGAVTVAIVEPAGP